MALNIKNPEVERLVEEIVSLTGETKTEAIRKALEDRRQRIALRASPVDRRARLREFLESEAWPSIPPERRGRALEKVEEESILGYGPDGA